MLQVTPDAREVRVVRVSEDRFEVSVDERVQVTERTRDFSSFRSLIGIIRGERVFWTRPLSSSRIRLVSGRLRCMGRAVLRRRVLDRL